MGARAGDAGPGRGGRRDAAAGRADPRPGAADRHHAGRRSAPGAEADAG